MGVVRSIGSLALATLLLSSVAAQAAAPPLARWTIFHVTGAGQDKWSAWYPAAPWPIRFRFKCQGGAVMMNAVNTDSMHQGVSVHYWDVEATEDAFHRAVQSGRATLNRGFQLPARQSVLRPVHRDVCGSASNSFVFGAYLGV
jgi:hypothetical protein